MSRRRPALRALAERLGVIASYRDHRGRTRQTTDDTRVALLAAMGVDGSTEAAAQRALRHDEARQAQRLIAPVRVARAGAAVTCKLATGALAAEPIDAVDWEIELRTEAGATHRAGGRCARAGIGITLRLPIAPPLGYHRLHVAARRPGRPWVTAEQVVIGAPPRCPLPDDQLGDRRVFGLLVNLYTVRSGRNWGIGNLHDLRQLVRWSGDIGAAFVGVNPLHAIANHGDQIAPYSPISRLYRNVLYLDVMDIPEARQTPSLPAQLAAASVRSALHAARAGARVDYARVWATAIPVLRTLHRTFVTRHGDGQTARGRAYRRYRAHEGDALTDFATFMTLHEHLGGGRADWHAWPAAYRDCRAPAIAAFRAAHPDDVEFHCYLQFELDRQLGTVAAAARRHDVPLGIYQDLALGSAAGGSDTWAFADLFVRQVSVGAPPDDYNAAGQDWSFPPLDPGALATGGYGYFVRLVRAALRHTGAVRIDHVMGLLRQYWIPRGAAAADGAYVKFPAEDLLAIVALEGTRAHALVVGEDLGTVPVELPALLARWGVLSTRILYFERDRRGAYQPARRYPARALVAANTHDLPTLAGFWRGRDLEIRRRLGIIATDAALEQARAERRKECAALLRLLRREGVLTAGALEDRSDTLRQACPERSRRAQGERNKNTALGERQTATNAPAEDPLMVSPSTVLRTGLPNPLMVSLSNHEPALAAAVHAFLCRTPAALVGVSLDDLAGEVEPVNLPGVPLQRYPSWSRRMQLALAALRRDAGVRRALAGTRRRRWRG